MANVIHSINFEVKPKLVIVTSKSTFPERKDTQRGITSVFPNYGGNITSLVDKVGDLVVAIENHSYQRIPELLSEVPEISNMNNRSLFNDPVVCKHLLGAIKANKLDGFRKYYRIPESHFYVAFTGYITDKNGREWPRYISVQRAAERPDLWKEVMKQYFDKESLELLINAMSKYMAYEYIDGEIDGLRVKTREEFTEYQKKMSYKSPYPCETANKNMLDFVKLYSRIFTDKVEKDKLYNEIDENGLIYKGKDEEQERFPVHRMGFLNLDKDEPSWETMYEPDIFETEADHDRNREERSDVDYVGEKIPVTIDNIVWSLVRRLRSTIPTLKALCNAIGVPCSDATAIHFLDEFKPVMGVNEKCLPRRRTLGFSQWIAEMEYSIFDEDRRISSNLRQFNIGEVREELQKALKKAKFDAVNVEILNALLSSDRYAAPGCDQATDTEVFDDPSIMEAYSFRKELYQVATMPGRTHREIAEYNAAAMAYNAKKDAEDEEYEEWLCEFMPKFTRLQSRVRSGELSLQIYDSKVIRIVK